MSLKSTFKSSLKISNVSLKRASEMSHCTSNEHRNFFESLHCTSNEHRNCPTAPQTSIGTVTNESQKQIQKYVDNICFEGFKRAPELSMNRSTAPQTSIGTVPLHLKRASELSTMSLKNSFKSSLKIAVLKASNEHRNSQ